MLDYFIQQEVMLFELVIYFSNTIDRKIEKLHHSKCITPVTQYKVIFIYIQIQLGLYLIIDATCSLSIKFLN